MNTGLKLTEAEQALGISLPYRRMEDWRWTDLRRAITRPYGQHLVAASAEEVARLLASSPFAKLAKTRVVFVNGVLDEAHSKLGALNLQKSAGELHDQDPLSALNRAVGGRGVTLSFHAAEDYLTEIIHLTTKAEARAIAVHNRINIAKDACASIIETFIGDGDYLLSSVTEFNIEQGASLERLKLQNEAQAATHLSHVTFNLESEARLNDVTLQRGSALTRQNVTCTFRGERAEARISGAYLLGHQQHVDTRLVVHHAVANCTSREVFKCVMDGKSRGIFQGKVIVARDAQKTDGKQSAHALLLSEAASFEAKPELEIYADDVICGHGATAGDLNEDHLFYLQSRGIPQAEAKALLITAFVGEAFDAVADENLHNKLMDMAESWVVR